MKPAHLIENIAHIFEHCSATHIKESTLLKKKTKNKQQTTKLKDTLEFKAADSEMPHYRPFFS